MSIYNPPRKGSISTEDISGSFYTKGQADNRFVHLSGNETINGEKTFEDDTKINGNLNVTGTVAENLRIEDNLITLNFGETADGITLGTAGIEIDRGTATDGYLVLAENVTGNDSDNRWVLDIGDGSAKSVFYDNFPDSASFDNTLNIGGFGSTIGSYILTIQGGPGDDELLRMRRQNALGGGFQFKASNGNVNLFLTSQNYTVRSHISSRGNTNELRIGTGSSPNNLTSAIYIDSGNDVRLNNSLVVEGSSDFNDIVNIEYNGTTTGSLRVTNSSAVDHSIARFIGDKSEILDIRNKDFRHYLSWGGNNDFILGKDSDEFRFAKGNSWAGTTIWKLDTTVDEFLFGSNYPVKIQNDFYITSLTPANSGNFLTWDANGKIVDSGEKFSSKTIESETESVSGTYTLTYDNAGQVFYTVGGTVILNQSPVQDEHLWIKNNGVLTTILSGGAYDIEDNNTKLLQPKDSNHLHFNNSIWNEI